MKALYVKAGAHNVMHIYSFRIHFIIKFAHEQY